MPHAARPPRGAFRCALVLVSVCLLAPAAPAAGIVKDNVRVSVKYILSSGGFRSPGVYGIETSIVTAFSDMNIILDRLDLRWRLLPVEIANVSEASDFYDITDENLVELERRARDEEPAKFKWRTDAINIYVVNTIDGAGGKASFPGNSSHRDIIVIASNIVSGEINNFSGGWLHEIGHYLSLTHTFQCSGQGCQSDPKVCQGRGASHRGWSAACPDVCPHDENIMSYDDLGAWGAEALRIGIFTDCQIEHMNYELYDPRGDRGKVLKPCSESCAELAAPCRDACEGVDDGCLGSCDAVDTICQGGCPAAGEACRGACLVEGNACNVACEALAAPCYGGCEAVCLVAPNSEACRNCRRECDELRASCGRPCIESYNACSNACPSPAQCASECAAQRSRCESACTEIRAACLAPCDGIEAACNGDCPTPPSAPVNLARRTGVEVSQSSDYAPGYTADLAIDGSLSTFTHTLRGAGTPASWRIDLGAEFDLETIVLENRRDDCCRSRLRDIKIRILDAQNAVQFESGLFNEKNAEGHKTLDGPERLVFHLPHLNADAGGKVRGQIVEVVRTPDPTLEGSGGQGNADEADVLSLAEVEVYGTAPPPASDVNLTRYLEAGAVVKATQSSTGYGGLAERAIDGNRSGAYFGGSVTHTADGDLAPWWEVDLGQSYPVGKVVIWNRTDCCAARLHNIRVSLLDATRTAVHTSHHFADGSYPDAILGQGYEVQMYGSEGRIVRIEHLGDLTHSGLNLSLAEVEVFTGPRIVPSARFVRGDTDSSGRIDLADAIATLGYLFTGGRAPSCLDAADVDDDGSLTITDAIGTLHWLFTGGRQPHPPSPAAPGYSGGDCGSDVNADEDLDCATPAATCGV